MQCKWLVLAVTSVAVFMSFLDATIVKWLPHTCRR